MNRTNGHFVMGAAQHPAADGPSAECDSGTNEICTRDFDVFQHVVLSLCLLENRCVLAEPLRIGVAAVLAARARRIVLRLDQPWITSAHCRWNPDERVFSFSETPLRNLAPPPRPIASH